MRERAAPRGTSRRCTRRETPSRRRATRSSTRCSLRRQDGQDRRAIDRDERLTRAPQARAIREHPVDHARHTERALRPRLPRLVAGDLRQVGGLDRSLAPALHVLICGEEVALPVVTLLVRRHQIVDAVVGVPRPRHEWSTHTARISACRSRSTSALQANERLLTGSGRCASSRRGSLPSVARGDCSCSPPSSPTGGR